jgi:hypothetical protein
MSRKIRIALDPSKSDAELAKLIMEIARENFDLPEGGDEDEEDEDDQISKHGGPGPHAGTGTEQAVHGRGHGHPGLPAPSGSALDPKLESLIDRKYRELQRSDSSRWDDVEGLNARDEKKPVRPGVDDDEEIRGLAEAGRHLAMEAEMDVTPIMQAVAEHTDGELKGFQNRIKTERSLRRKIAQDALELGIGSDQAAAQIRDVARYTITWEPDGQFFDKANTLLDAFESEGWSIYDHKDKNFFAPGDHYGGVNMNLVKDDMFVEVQLHTPQSYSIKDKSHQLYGQLRSDLSSQRRAKLISDIDALWNKDTTYIPPGWETFGTPSLKILKGVQLTKAAPTRHWVYTADGETPLGLFRQADLDIQRYDFESKEWVLSTYTLPDINGLGGSTDFERISDKYAAELIAKGLPAPKFSADIEIAKSDEYENLVFGWASVAFSKDGTQLVDMQGHAIDVEDLEKAAYDFTIHSYGTGDMHSSEGFGELVESMVFTDEKIELLGLDPGSIEKGWWVGFRVPPEYHEQVRTGKRTMFSIEGTAKLEPYTD